MESTVVPVLCKQGPSFHKRVTFFIEKLEWQGLNESGRHWLGQRPRSLAETEGQAPKSSWPLILDPKASTRKQCQTPSSSGISSRLCWLAGQDRGAGEKEQESTLQEVAEGGIQPGNCAPCGLAAFLGWQVFPQVNLQGG